MNRLPDTPGRPWWDGSEELRRYREAEAAEERVEAALAADDARRFGRTVVNSFGRGIGFTLGRDLVQGVLRALGWRR